MKERLNSTLKMFKDEIEHVKDINAAEELRIKFLGKKGIMTDIMKGMGKLSKEEKPEIGKIANEVRSEIEQGLEIIKQKAKQEMLELRLKSEKIDVTMPAVDVEIGHKHPLYLVLDEIKDIFIGMGYKIEEGPEVESVYHNFDALNAPKDHPSRSMSDTFYIMEDMILRTQTSPVQVRTMKSKKPPIRIIAPGRCFRNDELDSTHSPMFHQIEGLVVDKDITMADLKGTLDAFAKQIFGANTKTKFRPHYFPFTEPSAEVDVSCFKCNGGGCRFCKGSGWIEILGCGMVHPNVLKECGIDPEEYSGFAFGMGLDRITMLKYEIDDIRHFFENDMRFIKQF